MIDYRKSLYAIMPKTDESNIDFYRFKTGGLTVKSNVWCSIVESILLSKLLNGIGLTSAPTEFSDFSVDHNHWLPLILVTCGYWYHWLALIYHIIFFFSQRFAPALCRWGQYSCITCTNMHFPHSVQCVGLTPNHWHCTKSCTRISSFN